jgi:enamine deaminase RidA (YjgF/YER057c/UK114 family)
MGGVFMERHYINPPDIAPPPGDLYHHVVRVGNTVYISGQLSRGSDGRAAHVGDPSGQVRQVWANIEKAMTSVGGSVRDIVKTTTYVVGAENLPEVRRARLEILPPEERPTSTMVVVAGLADQELVVEVEAVAVLR